MELSDWSDQVETEWPKWCEDHQRSMMVWCLDCIAPVCERCTIGQAHGSHRTTGPDEREDCATQSSFLSKSAVGYWGNRTVLLEKMVGAMDGEVRVKWGTGGNEGKAWLEGTFGAVVDLEHDEGGGDEGQGGQERQGGRGGAAGKTGQQQGGEEEADSGSR